MSYNNKIQEFQTIAEYCLESGRFNTAANRFYYAALLVVKNLVSPESDTRTDHDRVLRSYYVHRYKQHKPVSAEDSTDLKTSWHILYTNRLLADYKPTNVKETEAMDSLDSFNMVKEIVWKNL